MTDEENAAALRQRIETLERERDEVGIQLKAAMEWLRFTYEGLDWPSDRARDELAKFIAGHRSPK